MPGDSQENTSLGSGVRPLVNSLPFRLDLLEISNFVHCPLNLVHAQGQIALTEIPVFLSSSSAFQGSSPQPNASTAENWIPRCDLLHLGSHAGQLDNGVQPTL